MKVSGVSKLQPKAKLSLPPVFFFFFFPHKVLLELIYVLCVAAGLTAPGLVAMMWSPSVAVADMGAWTVFCSLFRCPRRNCAPGLSFLGGSVPRGCMLLGMCKSLLSYRNLLANHRVYCALSHYKKHCAACSFGFGDLLPYP